MNYRYMRFAAVLVALCAGILQGAAAVTDDRRVSVSFEYAACSGFASNQFAVWVEDSSGKLVKTLFVTEFTAEKGYRKRADCLPEWVAAASFGSVPARTAAASDALSGATATSGSRASGYRMDAFSGATPKSGKCIFVWDFTDSYGNPVPSGAYTVKIEGTLFWEHRAVYCASVDSAVTGAAEVSVRQYPLSAVKGGHTLPERNRNMISNVAVTVQ